MNLIMKSPDEMLLTLYASPQHIMVALLQEAYSPVYIEMLNQRCLSRCICDTFV